MTEFTQQGAEHLAERCKELLRENADLRNVLNDAANALGEILPADHPHRSILERSNHLLDGKLSSAKRSGT